MKKLTLLLVAAVMISGGAFAEGKCCKKKGEKCTQSSACCKDKKNCKHECSKDAKATTVAPASAASTTAPKKTS